MKRHFIILLALVCPLLVQAQGKKNHNLAVAKNLDIFNQVYKNLGIVHVGEEHFGGVASVSHEGWQHLYLLAEEHGAAVMSGTDDLTVPGCVLP